MSGDIKVWEERRSRVGTHLEEEYPEVRSVLDLGCGDGKLFQLLKFNRQFTEFYGIDIDHRDLMNSASRVGPELDHVFAPVPANSNPLSVVMLQGDITRPSKKLKRDWDAITLVEVIEHLHPPELRALPAVIFGWYRPRMVIITTPNADYNACIRGFKHNTYGGFRHPDHKFEWSRFEFQEWAFKQCREFGYRVSFETVGRVNPIDEESFWELEKHGRCTQIAVFHPLEPNRSPSRGSASSDVDSSEEFEVHTPTDENDDPQVPSSGISSLEFGKLRVKVRVTFPREKPRTPRTTKKRFRSRHTHRHRPPPLFTRIVPLGRRTHSKDSTR